MGRRTTHNAQGTTLIELIMVITIVGVLVGVSSMYIKETIDLWSFLSFRTEAVAKQRMSLMRMAREMRQIKSNATIYNATATQFRFQDMNNATIEYILNATNVMRNADILVNNVNNLTFSYYDVNNTVVAVPVVNLTSIRRISINMTVQSGNRTKTVATQVYPRNF